MAHSAVKQLQLASTEPSGNWLVVQARMAIYRLSLCAHTSSVFSVTVTYCHTLYSNKLGGMFEEYLFTLSHPAFKPKPD